METGIVSECPKMITKGLITGNMIFLLHFFPFLCHFSFIFAKLILNLSVSISMLQLHHAFLSLLFTGQCHWVKRVFHVLQFVCALSRMKICLMLIYSSCTETRALEMTIEP